MIPKFTAAVALLPLFGAMATAGLLILGGRDAATSTTAINNSVKGVPALMTNIWTGYLGGSKEPTTLYGNSVEDILVQVRRYDPASATDSIASEISYVAFDNGQPEDLPDIGSPPTEWRGPGGPWFDYTKNGITYNYTCGMEGTADSQRTRDGARKLRNMHNDMAHTYAQTCARHWCWDTTAMYVCNWQDVDLSIPYYNIGWMTDGLDRLCCDDDYGKSGQMWHYRLPYSVVLGYGDCNEDPGLSPPYPMGSGNNGMCNAWNTTIW